MPRPIVPTIPIPPVISKVFSQVPFVLYPAPNTSTPAPERPTLWLLGPPARSDSLVPSSSSSSSSISSPSVLHKPEENDDKHLESLDPHCRQVQALARFLKVPHEIKWLRSAHGAPGGTLPSIHLPNGELLETEQCTKWILSNGGRSQEGGDRTASSAKALLSEDPTIQAYSLLLLSTVYPSVLAALELSSNTTPKNASKGKKSSESSANHHQLSVIAQDPNKPYLSTLVHTLFTASSVQTERLSEIKRLRGCKSSSTGTAEGAVLDLEELEREAIETIETFERKMTAAASRNDSSELGEIWFSESKHPTELDSWLYALGSIILLLPPTTISTPKSRAPLRYQPSLLRKALTERCPTLLGWLKPNLVQ